MRKIPAVWQRDMSRDGAPYSEVVTPGCEWVLAGEGIVTRKWDGTAVLVRGGKLFARYDAKHGKPPPPGFEPCQDHDPVTGHWPGWVPADRPQDKWIREAFRDDVQDGTYEACGPRIGGNAEGLTIHQLIQHGLGTYPDAPREFYALRAYLAPLDVEGVVFHHPDGRMAKATKQGFGMVRR
jgi:hypothetical protein